MWSVFNHSARVLLRLTARRGRLTTRKPSERDGQDGRLRRLCCRSLRKPLGAKVRVMMCDQHVGQVLIGRTLVVIEHIGFINHRSFSKTQKAPARQFFRKPKSTMPGRKYDRLVLQSDNQTSVLLITVLIVCSPRFRSQNKCKINAAKRLALKSPTLFANPASIPSIRSPGLPMYTMRRRKECRTEYLGCCD